jgi:hypothetical protein
MTASGPRYRWGRGRTRPAHGGCARRARLSRGPLSARKASRRSRRTARRRSGCSWSLEIPRKQRDDLISNLGQRIMSRIEHVMLRDSVDQGEEQRRVHVRPLRVRAGQADARAAGLSCEASTVTDVLAAGHGAVVAAAPERRPVSTARRTEGGADAPSAAAWRASAALWAVCKFCGEGIAWWVFPIETARGPALLLARGCLRRTVRRTAVSAPGLWRARSERPVSQSSVPRRNRYRAPSEDSSTIAPRSTVAIAPRHSASSKARAHPGATASRCSSNAGGTRLPRNVRGQAPQ